MPSHKIAEYLNINLGNFLRRIKDDTTYLEENPLALNQFLQIPLEYSSPTLVALRTIDFRNGITGLKSICREVLKQFPEKEVDIVSI